MIASPLGPLCRPSRPDARCQQELIREMYTVVMIHLGQARDLGPVCYLGQRAGEVECTGPA
jgi:hypothetical protein